MRCWYCWPPRRMILPPPWTIARDLWRGPARLPRRCAACVLATCTVEALLARDVHPDRLCCQRALPAIRQCTHSQLFIQQLNGAPNHDRHHL
jgi:hypothetical protein